MSDLAPFVAAVLRDKTVADMKEENDSLKQENDSLRQQLRDIRAVQITGRNGSPFYTRAQLVDGQVMRGDLNQYLVRFPGEQVPGLYTPRDLMNNLEVHVGGFGRIETIRGPYLRHEYHQDTQYGIWLCAARNRSSALRYVEFVIGPFTSEAEFNGYDPNANATNLLPDTNINGESIHVYFCLAGFKSSAVSGLIDNFDHRLQQAQEAAAAAAAAAAQETVVRPLSNVDDNDA